MNSTLTLHRPAPLRAGLLLVLSIAFLFASALSVAPTIIQSSTAATASSHADICKCAHCPGEAKCCCTNNASICPLP